MRSLLTVGKKKINKTYRLTDRKREREFKMIQKNNNRSKCHQLEQLKIVQK